ncbi:hypothetical protein S40285_09297 [Stachybotrys chlorohalonatus IBT 40285]|uniref:Major facilitator superfamily (MFS) profile domain-containing protein n=1 Tax=Stachybotrys chlorohalonatus (strain IBT 40285) TaxID=1283841 RepID=A0A084QZG2_STAC4|nr:hypothetical protein S40285_09297 [Stachybotrys chlorohalonata IBT 40285]
MASFSDQNGRITNFLEHVGLISLHQSTADVKLLCLQRFMRLFAYGTSTLVLVSFLRELGISQTRIGLFMTLTLMGDVAISFVLAFFADAVGRRVILGLGAVLMIASGVVFAFASSYWALLAAAILGVISPSGSEIGPFRAVEESTIAHLTASSNRGDIYAWYSLSGNAGTAFGTVVCGWAIHAAHAQLEWPLVDVYRLAFYAYTAFGFFKLALVLMLSQAVEAETETSPATGGVNSEIAPLLPASPSSTNTQQSMVPNFKTESRPVVLILCLLFALDSFASGLAPLSWVMYFFKARYGIEEGGLGSIFFVTGIIAAASTIVASSLAKRLGNVQTMVFTHLPSSIFLALIPVPNQLHWSIAFLVLRACTQSMDVAPRSAFLAAILRPEERTKSMGLINVVKTCSQSVGPFITGLLAASNLFWVSFLVAGSLKALYDMGMLGLFRNHERVKTMQGDEIEGRP